MVWLYITLWVFAVLLVYVITKYNAIVKLRNIRSQSFADVDVQLKLRFDLIPNLIETVKWYATHEKETLENVTKARTSFMNATGIEDKMQADNMLTWALKSLFAVSENYPDLKANQNFLELQRELTDTENKIQAARRFYNTNVRDFTIATKHFPSNIVASMFGFKSDAFFELPEGQEAAKEPVRVNF